MTAMTASTITAPTRFLDVANQSTLIAASEARMLPAQPLLCLQHFTGTLDNWDPAVIDQLSSAREVILFDNGGVGRSTGTVPETVAAMATHAFASLDGLGIDRCDVLGFPLGGMIRTADGPGSTIDISANDPPTSMQENPLNSSTEITPPAP